MYYVYILRSKKDKERFCIGYTTDIDRRLKEHNESRSLYTKRYSPWCIETCISFSNKELAKEFERYIKRGSGKTFAKRRLMAAL